MIISIYFTNKNRLIHINVSEWLTLGQFEPWKWVCIYIYILFWCRTFHQKKFWCRTWWTSHVWRENETKTQKGEGASFRGREKRGREEVGGGSIWYLCALFCLFYYCICMCTQIQHNTTAVYSVLCPKHPIYSNYICQEAKLRLLSFCGFVHYKIEPKDYNSLTFSLGGEGNFFFFFFFFNSIIYKV